MSAEINQPTVEVKVEMPTVETVSPSSVNQPATFLEGQQWNQGDVVSVLKNTLHSVTNLLQESKVFVPALIWIVGGWIGLKLGLSLLGALFSVVNSIPLLPALLELVGVGYVAWFTNRYLLGAAKRQELSQKVGQIKRDVLGENDLAQL